jgi:hypothetical protein
MHRGHGDTQATEDLHPREAAGLVGAPVSETIESDWNQAASGPHMPDRMATGIQVVDRK